MLLVKPILPPRVRDPARIALSEPSIAIARHDTVHEVAKGFRNREEQNAGLPGKGQLSGDTKRRARFRVDGPSIDEDHAVDRIGRKAVLLEQLSSPDGQKRREVKTRIEIALENESDAAVAEVAHAVEKDDRKVFAGDRGVVFGL